MELADLKEYRKRCQGKYYKFEDDGSIRYLKIIKVDLFDNDHFREFNENLFYDKRNCSYNIWKNVDTFVYIADPLEYDYIRVTKSEYNKIRNITEKHIRSLGIDLNDT